MDTLKNYIAKQRQYIADYASERAFEAKRLKNMIEDLQILENRLKESESAQDQRN